jgi:hypothetical protein
MDLNPLYRRLGGHQSYTGRVRKISLSTGIRSQKHLLRSELVYRLNYAGSFRNGCSIKNVSPESVCLHNFWIWKVSITASGWSGAVWDAAGCVEHGDSCKTVHSLQCYHN